MKKSIGIIYAIILGYVILSAVSAIGAVEVVPPAEARSTALELVKTFVINAWPALVLWLISEIQPFLPTKSNGIVHLVVLWLRNRTTGGGTALMLALVALTISGCTTLNVSTNIANGDHNKPGIKTDADAKQDISPNTTATIPLK